MRIEPEISGVSVVLLGSFNPAIFAPAWFALHGILPRRVADNADLQVVHKQQAMFSTEWLRIRVTPDRFEAETQQDPHVRVRDFVIRVFKELLFHTPVEAFGINRHVHFRAPDTAARDRVGRILAPVEPWGECAEVLQLCEEQSGMVSLTMRQSQPEDRPEGGHIDVMVEPSVRIGDGRQGIYVQVNDHYAIDSSETDGRPQLLGFLEDRFEPSIQRADSIVNHVMALATDREGK